MLGLTQRAVIGNRRVRAGRGVGCSFVMERRVKSEGQTREDGYCKAAVSPDGLFPAGSTAYTILKVLLHLSPASNRASSFN